MRPFRFSDPDLPDDLQDTKVWRLANRLGHSRCFYLGIECLFHRTGPGMRGLDPFPLAATREHLIPKGRCDLNDREAELNIVIASSWMNNLVANAPLPVKLEVRDNVQQCLDPGLDPEEMTDDLLDCLAGRTYQVLNEYRLGRKFPWQLSSFTDPAEKDLAAGFMATMAERERRLFRDQFLIEGSDLWLPVDIFRAA